MIRRSKLPPSRASARRQLSTGIYEAMTCTLAWRSRSVTLFYYYFIGRIERSSAR
jgi:hypothetical protein